MKKLLIAIFISINLSALVSCQGSVYKINESIDEYISISYSLYEDSDNDESDIGTEIYYYNTRTKETKKVFQFQYTSQYPLGIYDEAGNTVYYSKRVAERGCWFFFRWQRNICPFFNR